MKSVVRLLTVLLLCLSFVCALFPAALAENSGEDCEVILTQNWGDFGAALSDLVREGMDEVHAAGYSGRYETARLIVKMRGELPDLSRFAPKTILRDPENHYLIQFASPQEAENCADFLAELDDVIYVEPDSIVSISDSDESADAESAADVTPDSDESETAQTEITQEEPYAAAQEQDISADMPDTETAQSDGEREGYPEKLDEADALEESDNSVYSTAKSWGVAAIHADEYAADLVSRGKTGFVAVGVVDSGVDLSHPMLSGRLLDGYDFVESDAIPQDEHSHGTHVSGIIVDSTPGLNIYILPVRAFNAEGKGSSSTVALGVRYAADNGASVINLSLGGEHNNYKEEAIEYAMQKGITVVASAGNEGIGIGTNCPAHIAGCITVASVNQSLNRSSFSNYGSTVDIAAPGENIYSSVLNGSYGYKDGTSMAAPYVSAAAAMLMCDNPGANVASLLCGAATDLGAAGWDSYYGAGLLNLESFVQSGPKHYTVAYNANGGSGAPARQRKTAGETLTLANGRPVRMDGSTSRTVKLNACGGSVSKSTLTASAKIRYAFQGWNTMDDGSGTDYAPRASYTADESVTLFAQWTESYYDIEALQLPTAVRAGYTFLGWADSPDAESGLTGSYTPEANTELYAIWRITGALNDSISWTLFDNGKLLLTGSGKMPNFSYPDYAPWYAHREQITQLVISEGVTSIGNYAFNGCSGLTSVTIPERVTSIGSAAFDGCSGLESVTIPDSVTSIGSDAFEDCSGLQAVNISDLRCWLQISFSYSDSNPLTYAHKLYLNGNEVTALVIPEGVTSIGSYAFRGCSGLTSVTIPESVTAIGSSAFSDCSGLTSVTIPDSVTSIGYSAFSGCSGLQAVNISDLRCWLQISFSNTYSNPLGDAHRLYLGGEELTTVVIPDGVTSICYSFYGCSGLTSVTIPESVTSIGNYAFSDCSKLKSVTIPDSVTSIGGAAFQGCSGLTSVTIPEGVTSIGNGAFSDCSKLKSVTIPDGVTSIGRSAFDGCRGLTSVTIPESVTSIGDSAFYDCSKLTSVTIPESVTSIGESAFYACRGLTSVTILEGVTSIGNSAFYYCSGLRSVTIPESVTSIGDSAFYDCSKLTSVTIPEGVTSIGSYAFSGCSGLMSVTIQEGVTSIGSYAFRGCSGLTSVTIPNSVTSIGNAFSGCSGLTSVTIPDSVRSIGDYAFSGCSSLTSVTIPDSVTSIGNSAFGYCDSLTSVTIGKSVTGIGMFAFERCSNLTSIFFTGNVPTIYSSAFWGVTATAYYPAESTNDHGYYGSGNLTWKLYQELYTVAYDSNGGAATRGKDPVASGESVTLPTAQREGYAFLGWAESADAISARYLAGETFTPAESMTLYAVWQWDNPQPDALLPAGLRELEDEALAGTPFHVVRLPEGMTRIGSRVFDGCPALIAVYVPASVTDIAPDAFEGVPETVVIVGSADSAAQHFAATHGITFQLG